MGDLSTHLIFYQSRWYLAYHEHHLDNTYWINTSNMQIVCPYGVEEKKFELSEIK